MCRFVVTCLQALACWSVSFNRLSVSKLEETTDRESHSCIRTLEAECNPGCARVIVLLHKEI
jgi:hypothetical protein